MFYSRFFAIFLHSCRNFAFWLVDWEFVINSKFSRDFFEIFLFPKILSLNPLSANPTKWSNTLKEFVRKSWRIIWVCLTILWGWRLKGKVVCQLMRQLLHSPFGDNDLMVTGNSAKTGWSLQIFCPWLHCKHRIWRVLQQYLTAKSRSLLLPCARSLRESWIRLCWKERMFRVRTSQVLLQINRSNHRRCSVRKGVLRKTPVPEPLF